MVSPFAQTQPALVPRRSGGGRIFAILGGLFLAAALAAVTVYLVMRYLDDPYRTLESFPVAKYLDDYHALAGSTFKAQLRVEADLGWKEGAGRLMLFSTPDDGRPIAVMIPVAVGKDVYFTKGQTYLAQVEVKEGGLIYADSFQKD